MTGAYSRLALENTGQKVVNIGIEDSPKYNRRRHGRVDNVSWDTKSWSKRAHMTTSDTTSSSIFGGNRLWPVVALAPL